MNDFNLQPDACPSCGTSIPIDSVFCPGCGRRRDVSEATVPSLKAAGGDTEVYTYPSPQPVYAPQQTAYTQPTQPPVFYPPAAQPVPIPQVKQRYLALWIASIVLRVIAWIIMIGGWVAIIAVTISAFTGVFYLEQQEILGTTLGNFSLGWIPVLLLGLVVPVIAAFPFFALADYLSLLINLEANQRAQLSMMTRMNGG